MRCRLAILISIAALALSAAALTAVYLYPLPSQGTGSGYTSLGSVSGAAESYEFKDLMGFDQVQLTFSDMRASASNADLVMEMSKDNGATWESAHYNTGGSAVNPKGGTISLTNDIDAAMAHIYLAMDDKAGSQNAGQFEFLSLQSPVNYKPFHGWAIGFYQADHQAWPGFINGYLRVTAPIDAIRLRYVDHANNAKALSIAQGKASMVGIRR